MIQWGINALNHGSSLAVFKDSKFKSLSVSNNDRLESNDITQALHDGSPDEIYWYEQPWLKKARQVYAGQYRTALDMSVLPSRYLKEINLGYAKLKYTPHHASHAAAGYYTSPFNHCAVVVLDAIGEFTCASIWVCAHGEIKRVWASNYPHSLGLFYSAFTKLVGLEPIKQEHLLQQMAENGDPLRYRDDIRRYFKGYMQTAYNFHRGVNNWTKDIRNIQDQCDIAAAAQQEFENQVEHVMYTARMYTGSESLVYMGGCAMNSAANKRVEKLFKYIWSLPNPGDATSAIGAVAYHNKNRIWQDWGPVKHIDIRV